MYTRVGAAGIAAAAAVIGFVARSLASDDLDGPAAGAGSAVGGVQVSGGGFRATLDLWAAVLERLGLGGAHLAAGTPKDEDRALRGATAGRAAAFEALCADPWLRGRLAAADRSVCPC